MSAARNNAAEGVGQTSEGALSHLQELLAEAHLHKRPANLRAALRMGELVQRYLSAATLEGGSAKAPPSFRDLARAAKLGRSASALCRSVQIYELAQLLPELRSFTHVSPTHVRTVVNLQLSQQRLLLIQAEAEHWSCSRLEKAAGELRRTATEALDHSHRGRTSGFFSTPGAQVARSLSASLTRLLSAQQHATRDFPLHIKQDIERKLREFEVAIRAISKACELSPAGADPASSPEAYSGTSEEQL